MQHLALIGFQELWPILLILVLLFGAKKLPELARSMGMSINMFKKGLSDAEDKAELTEGKGHSGGNAEVGAADKERTTTQ